MPIAYGLQIDIAWQDRATTVQRVEELLSKNTPEPGSLLVLPEMFDVGFTMKALLANDDPEQITHRFCSQLARRTGCAVLAGFARSTPDGRVANVATFFDEAGREIGRYEKTHPFSIVGEGANYAAGSGPVVIDWQGMKIAPMICYDLRFPELFRLAMKQGAEVFLLIANWPSARVEHWTTLSRARAIENLAYVVAVNRCGTDPKLSYPGRSQIIDPKGNVLADAGESVGVVSAPIDIDLVRTWRREFPVLGDVKLI
jgi:predicted amidohydrolase